jgi:hypothetical protein
LMQHSRLAGGRCHMRLQYETLYTLLI